MKRSNNRVVSYILNLDYLLYRLQNLYKKPTKHMMSMFENASQCSTQLYYNTAASQD